MPKLDRSAFFAGTHQEVERQQALNQPATLEGRLEAAAYLNSIAYGYSMVSPPRIDRTICKAGKLSERQRG